MMARHAVSDCRTSFQCQRLQGASRNSARRDAPGRRSVSAKARVAANQREPQCGRTECGIYRFRPVKAVPGHHQDSEVIMLFLTFVAWSKTEPERK